MNYMLTTKQNAEINQLLDKIDPCLHGHRAIITLAAVKLIAIMLCPAHPTTQEETLRRLRSNVL
jgi:hypothetical protein